MSQPASPPSFIFSELIDRAHLASLYEDDYQWIEEIFSTAMTHFDEDVTAIRGFLAAGDLPGLQRAIHKIKPTFGFVGIPVIQDQCKHVEDKIAAAGGDLAPVENDVRNLLSQCQRCKDVINADLQRLIQFNRNHA